MARKPTGDKPNDIRKATVAELAEHGLKSASVNRIAQRAGLSVGTIYRFHDSKDALLRHVYLQIKTDIHDQIMAAANAQRSSKDRLQAAWQAMLDHAFDFPEDFAFHEMIANSAILSDSDLAEIDKLALSLAALVQEGITSAALRDVPVGLIITMLTAPALQVARQSARGKPRPSAADLDMLFEMCWRSVSEND